MALDESWAHVSTPEMEEEDKQNGMVGSEANVLKEEWGEASRLLFQPGYLKVIKEMALSGQLQQYNIRSVCWRLFLGCLPEDQSKWAESVKKSREKFTAIKNKHIVDPHSCESGKDLVVHNPLSLADDSPWNQFFQDNDLKQMIKQDVVRTFPDVQFFRQPHIQSTLTDLLFCYSRENEELGYRQGMHEILAPIVFVLNAEMRDLDDPTLAPPVLAVMDPRYIEHDIYTIFAELMESVGPWYQSTALEADFFKARAQNAKKMSHDPRTNKPFQEFSDFAPTSAISRKLGVIHNLHLKNADELLYSHLKELSIPPQTYGIRWIRLLFGREFPLPTMLELWDALFADGPSLGLVDYMCVAMLMHIRNVLTGGDYASCMQYLMHFPPVYEVNYLVQRALHLRNPSVYPSPRIWSHSPSAQATYSLGSVPSSSPTETTTHHRTQPKLPKVPSGVRQFAKHVQLPKLQRGSRTNSAAPRLEFHSSSKSRSRSPSPTNSTPVTDHPLQGSLGSAEVISKPKGRGRIIGSVKSEPDMVKKSKEMSDNPKSAPLTTDSSSQLDKLRNRVDDLQAKCLYCGGKADSLILSLQNEIIKLDGLPPETENTLLLSLAGLKHVRDLLLNKIPFSGESVEGWENVQGTKFSIDNSLDSSDGPPVSPNEESKSSPPAGDDITVTKDSNNRTLLASSSSSDSQQRSLEVGTEVLPDDVEGDEWVSLSSHTHPLLSHPLTGSGN